MPFVDPINKGALSGQDPTVVIDSIVRQLNEWAAEISNEKIATVQRGENGNARIVQGAQRVGDVSVIGTVYYDNNNVDRIFIGLAPDDGRPGIWISETGESVIGLLEA